MKKIIVLALFGLLPLLALCQSQVAVHVYYFHITNRCHTCISIEEQVKKTLDDHFADEVREGRVILHVLNCELPENKALADKYLAYGSTLAITRVQNGKEGSEDITGWAFQKIGKPEIFIAELKLKIESALKP